MIRKSINIRSNPIQMNEVKPIKPESSNVKEYAESFLKGMGEIQRMRFKRMLENGINCGMSVAEGYGVDYNTFIREVKKQLEVD